MQFEFNFFLQDDTEKKNESLNKLTKGTKIKTKFFLLFCEAAEGRR